jgi:hypothetical protein
MIVKLLLYVRLLYTAVAILLPAPQIIPPVATALPFGFKWGVQIAIIEASVLAYVRFLYTAF